MTRAAKRVVVLTVGAALAALVCAIVPSDEVVPDGPSAMVILVVVAVAALAEFATLPGNPEDGDAAFALSASVYIAAVMLLDPVWAAVAAGAGCAVGEVARRRPGVKVAFNAAVMSLSTLAAAVVYRALSGAPEERSWFVAIPDVDAPATFLAVAVALCAYIAVSGLAVSAVSSATLGQSFRPWRLLTPSVLGAYLMEGALGVVAAVLVVEAPLVVPFIVPLLLAVFLSLSRHHALKRETREALRALAAAIDARDPYTARHSERVGDVASRLAAAAGLPEKAVARTRWAGRLHDIGKVIIDNSILHKDGPLDDDDEWALMRLHAQVSSDLIAPLSLMRELVPIVRMHHERWDGRGYYSVPGSQVPLESYCIGLADSFDAMTTDRPYRRGMDPEEALRRIEDGAGTQFHEALARAFTAMMRGEPVQPLEKGSIQIQPIGRSPGQTSPARSPAEPAPFPSSPS